MVFKDILDSSLRSRRSVGAIPPQFQKRFAPYLGAMRRRASAIDDVSDMADFQSFY